MTTLLRRAGRLLLAAPLLLGLAGPAHGQQPALRRLYPAAAPDQDSLLRLGGTLVLEARDLPPVPLAGLTLYLNGLPLRGLAPLAAYTVADSTATLAAQAAAPVATAAPAGSWPDSAATHSPATAAVPAPSVLTRVVFALRREAAPTAWALADGSPWQPAHPVRLGLGSATRQLLELAPGPAGAVQLAPAWGWLAGPALVALAGLLLLIAAGRSWLLRAPAPLAYDTDGYRLPVAEAAPPYSLARTQLAWWSFLVLGGGLLNGCLTGGLPTLPIGTLALLGASAGTAALAALASARPATPTGEPARSRGWLADLLCDERGLAIHRLQLVVTALAVGGSLVSALYATGGLPDWLPGPAILLACSGLAYVAPKWQVGRTAARLAPAADAAETVATAPAEPAAWATLPSLVSAAPAGPAAAPFAPVAPVVASPLPEPQVQAPLPPAAQARSQPVPAAAAAPAAVPPAVELPQLVAPAVIEAAPPVLFETKSRADLATGEVLYHEEDDMGPSEEDDMGLPEEEPDYLRQPGVG
jgi:hypothetical protein